MNEATLAEEVDLESPGVRRLLTELDRLRAIEARARLALNSEDRDMYLAALYILGERPDQPPLDEQDAYEAGHDDGYRAATRLDDES